MSATHFYCIHCGTALQRPADSRVDLVKCDDCARHVPVPRPMNGPGNLTSYPHVFPPGVMELLVKFQCTACGTGLHADARYEGRAVACSHCGVRTQVPRWSHAAEGLRSQEAVARARKPARVQAPLLSEAEIDFLRGADPAKPVAVA